VLCLTVPTDSRWASAAIANLDAVLVDHAHCEMKAASNAMSLATRPPIYPDVARALASLAEEELDHFRRVIDVLEARGVTLGPPEVDEYAARLLKTAQKSARKTPSGSLAERLIVGALIEARSCERFKLLEAALRAAGDPLADFYRDLLASEARHYTTFVDLATRVTGDEAWVKGRVAELAEQEGVIVKELGVRATIHG
jgi:tRNA-(ms[2]io[6]A)-hydroxylase